MIFLPPSSSPSPPSFSLFAFTFKGSSSGYGPACWPSFSFNPTGTVLSAFGLSVGEPPAVTVPSRATLKSPLPGIFSRLTVLCRLLVFFISTLFNARNFVTSFSLGFWKIPSHYLFQYCFTLRNQNQHILSSSICPVPSPLRALGPGRPPPTRPRFPARPPLPHALASGPAPAGAQHSPASRGLSTAQLLGLSSVRVSTAPWLHKERIARCSTRPRVYRPPRQSRGQAASGLRPSSSTSGGRGSFWSRFVFPKDPREPSPGL